ncbi:hypothetical protein J0383_05250 [Flavobacterium endoglycinae]|uniref:PepSY domain-containing protein n=1 Tax=Flavobacterium endoglycinae TaxID=2816357 RepID=A0ABX7QI16_9FLAO|nr:hypothetical protein [Flavobacterium endoglycinae]QSW90226.1 hypothetical protein J0383_05250 [Flavobacterium endoglycinae]
MRIILLFLCIFSIANTQHKNPKTQFIEKSIQSCRIPLNDSTSIINVHENLYGNDVEIILKTENTITNECINKVITPEMITKFKTSQNPIININKHRIDDINIIEFKNLIPNKISSIKKTKYTILAIELYNFSFTTVGSTYIYLSFKIDTKGKVLKTKILESKSSIKIDNLLTI